MKIQLEFFKWTKNYAVFKYSRPKVGVVYIPREILKDEIICDPHLIFHTQKAKDSTHES